MAKKTAPKKNTAAKAATLGTEKSPKPNYKLLHEISQSQLRDHERCIDDLNKTVKELGEANGNYLNDNVKLAEKVHKLTEENRTLRRTITFETLARPNGVNESVRTIHNILAGLNPDDLRQAVRLVNANVMEAYERSIAERRKALQFDSNILAGIKSDSERMLTGDMVISHNNSNLMHPVSVVPVKVDLRPRDYGNNVGNRNSADDLTGIDKLRGELRNNSCKNSE